MHFKSRILSLLFFLCALIGGTCALAADAGPEWRYSVRPGDTLIGFSKRYLKEPANWDQLQKLNALVNPHRLRPGQTLRIPISLLKQKPVPAELVAVSGRVQIGLPGAPLHDAVAGEKLPAGSVLQTGADSSATLRLADGSVLVLQPGSSMLLDTMSLYEGGGMVDARVRLQQGRVEISANPKRSRGSHLEVITPSAVAAVRGTRFRVAAEDAVAKEETLEGRVALAAAQQEVELPGGYGSVAEQGKPPSQPVALLAAPDLQLLPAKAERLPVRFDLPLQKGAAGWIGQIAPDKAFDRILLEKQADLPHLTFADLPEGKYVLRVRAMDSLGLQGMDGLHAFELDARPFPPLMLAPANAGIVRNARPELMWSEAEDASAYQIELASDAAFRNKLIDRQLQSTWLQPEQALAPGDYYLRVASLSGEDRGPFSEPVSFHYKPLPDAPDLSQPALAFNKNTMQVNLPQPPEGLKYEAELVTDESRAQVIWVGQSADGKLQMPRPPAGKCYLSVRMLEADGTAGPFATQAIDVPQQRHWEPLIFLLPLLAL